MTPSTTLALLAALYHWKDINEPERLGEDMGHGAHNGIGAGDDNDVLDAQARGQNAEPDAFEEGYKACKNGLDYTCNPYENDPFSVFKSEWSKGWTAAFQENELIS